MIYTELEQNIINREQAKLNNSKFRIIIQQQ